jgi:hypothetical protein
MNISLIRQIVWLDFRLAVIFTVIIPLILLLWSWQAGIRAIQRSLVIYWRTASLLAITVLLMIGNLPISFLSGISARVLIPLSLWFWQDLNEEIAITRHQLCRVYQAWRWTVSLYCLGGLPFNLVFANCGLLSQEELYNTCRVWFEPPEAFQKIFLGAFSTENIIFAGIVGLGVYILYFAVFLIFNLPKQGRIAFRE